jgi:hypothetical protein
VSPYIPLGLISIGFCAVLFLFHRYQDSKKRMETIKNFPSYVTTLNYYLEKAYEIIHKDRMLIYSLEATRVPDKDFDVITKDFINLVFKLIGPKLTEEFIYVFGDLDTFIFNMTEFFNTKYEEDEVRKDAVSAMMDQEIEAEEESAGE